MYSWLTLVGAGGTALATLGLALHRLHKHGPVVVTRATHKVVGAAWHEAEQRGHRPLTVTHVALALISDPSVARELERNGVSLKELYSDVEVLLPPRADSPIKLLPADVAPSLEALFRKTGRRLAAPGPMGVLRTLLASEHEDVRSAFEQHGVTAELWPQSSSRPSDSAPALARDGESGPYRGLPSGSADTDVVFWNDTRTTQGFVTQVLRGTFGVVEPDATRLVLSVDQDGFAVVGTYERDEAERLARTAMQLARQHGYPLRVSIAETGRTNAMSSIERWLHRW